ncbi:DUF6891 domain-containing protein [Actinomadura sp. LOL_016]|uniref:DUF6891 domain-containing protein n=1 Tax=unclassified Actinomadura TaxID=2626254 RepID=UPI003A8112C2
MTHNSVESSVQHHARFLVALGRHDFETVVRQCTELQDSDEDVRRVVADEFAAHLADQATWPDDLDTDRLHRAFRELDASGIVARLDHTCCQNCGISEIGDEVAAGDGPRGYVFAHRQDMEAAVPEGVLTLAYGLFIAGEQPPEAQAEIGREVAAALRRHGLEVDWDGSPRRRIDVPLTWRRRRYGERAGFPGAPASPDPADDDALEVSFADERHGPIQNASVWMPFPYARDVLLSVTPYSGSFINYENRSGKSLVMIWESGPRLWIEHPDPPNRRSYGRHVTVSEAEELIGVLAREDRIALTGDLTTNHWGG